MNVPNFSKLSAFFFNGTISFPDTDVKEKIKENSIMHIYYYFLYTMNYSV